MHNVAYPVDSSFWDTAYPPNGWGCQCYVVSMDDEELKEYGVQKGDAMKASGLNIHPDWIGNVGRDALVPKFDKMPYLMKNKEAMLGVLRNYAKDMKNASLTRDEFSALAKKLDSYEASPKPNVPLILGVMNDDVHKAIKNINKKIDVKIHGSTQGIMHGVRKIKDNKVVQNRLGEVWETMQDPDIVYLEKTEIMFFKKLNEKEYINVAFGNKDKNILQLRSFNYFQSKRILQEIKEKIYEKK